MSDTSTVHVQSLNSPPLTQQASTPAASQTRRKRRSDKGDAAITVLACQQCRAKKVKCVLEGRGCGRCNRLGVDCVWRNLDQRKCPSSKSHIRELEDRIASLETALAAARNTIESITAEQPPAPVGTDLTATDSVASSSPVPAQRRASSIPSLASIDSLPSDCSSDGDENIISRMCGRQWKLNSDEEGQYKFFGPTSSLHLTESVSSSLLESGFSQQMSEDGALDGMIDHDTHCHLLEIYWKYQHTILQVFDKEIFLEGLKTRHGKYFSKALLFAVYACAARISDRPGLRAMVVPAQEDMSHIEPCLAAMAAGLVNEELQRPRVTTIQALLLLSVIYCSLGKDTKGWISTGVACSLAIDFGLHKSGHNLASAKLSRRDIKVRQLTYWGCLVFDRLWAKYLGRPVSLRDEDVELELSRPIGPDATWDTKIAYAWVSLLMVVGNITDALNRVKCSPETLHAQDEQLQDWYNNLDPELQYSPTAPPSVTLLHMEYYSSKIHLYRPTANFGSSEAQDSLSRGICIENAVNIAGAIANYSNIHGDVSTMSGVGLHMIATAATILIANIAEKCRVSDTSRQMRALQTCIRALCELERTYIVARRVRRIIRLILGLCHVDIGIAGPQQPLPILENTAGATVAGATGADAEGPMDLFASPGTNAGSLGFPDVAMDMFGIVSDTASLWTEELPVPSGYREFDIMYNLGANL